MIIDLLHQQPAEMEVQFQNLERAVKLILNLSNGKDIPGCKIIAQGFVWDIVVVFWNSLKCIQTLISFLFPSVCAVHRRSHIWRSKSHVDSLSKSTQTEDRHISQRKCWRVSCQPTSSLGTGHRHPEGPAAGLHTYMANMCTRINTYTHTRIQIPDWHVG